MPSTTAATATTPSPYMHSRSGSLMSPSSPFFPQDLFAALQSSATKSGNRCDFGWAGAEERSKNPPPPPPTSPVSWSRPY